MVGNIASIANGAVSGTSQYYGFTLIDSMISIYIIMLIVFMILQSDLTCGKMYFVDELCIYVFRKL
jgi:hypothetical protein